MNRRVSAAFLCLGMLSLGASALAAPPPSRAARPELSPSGRAAPNLFDTSGIFDGNEIRSGVTNIGIIARSPDGGAGFEWPQGTGKKVVYSAGLWLSASVSGTPRSAIADFGSEFLPGPMTASGEPADPTGSSKVYRVWKITQDDLTNPSLDYIDWPSSQGAPLDTADAPLLLGEQTLFSVFNDAERGMHFLINGSTLPLQAQVSQLVWGYNRPYEMSRVMFVKYHVHNRSRFNWAELYVGIWSDPDVGDPNDDLAGCDPSLQLGYVYDSDSPFRRDVEPAVGVMVLADSIPGEPSPGLRSFAGYDLSEDPAAYAQTLSYLRGLKRTGAPWTCPPGTRFPFSGDPAAGTGCLDSIPGDRRMVLSAGPFNVVSNSSLDVVVAYLVGSDPAARVPADNVTALKRLAEKVRDTWRTQFADIPPLSARITVHASFPNPASDVTTVDLEIPGGASLVRVEVLDVRGRVVWTVPTPEARSGIARVRWAGETVGGVPAPAGVYLLRVVTDSGPVFARTVRLR